MSSSKSLKFARMANNLSTLVLVSLLRALVCLFANKDQLRSELADDGFWRMMEATVEKSSDPQSPLHQVTDEICWHDCHIASPSQSSCLEVYFARLPRTLPTSRPRWRDTVVMTPWALLISAPDRMLLPAYLGSKRMLWRVWAPDRSLYAF